jgi:hypothetical protein
VLFFLALTLAATALTLLISRATITEPLRDAAPALLQEGLRCTLCTGFWVSLATVAVWGAPAGLSPILAALAVWGGVVVACGLAERF